MVSIKESYIRQIDNLLEKINDNLSYSDISESYYQIRILIKRIFGNSTYLDELNETELYRVNVLGKALSNLFASDIITKLRGILLAMRNAIEENDYPSMPDWVSPKHEIFGEQLNELQFQTDIFMMMPFKEPFWTIYNNTILPTVNSLNLTIKTGKDVFSGKPVMQDIWSLIYSSRVVIADCTGRNTNVFYEMGIAHTVGKKVIPISQKIKDIPFDIRHFRYVAYDPNDMKSFEENLSNALKGVLEE